MSRCGRSFVPYGYTIGRYALADLGLEELRWGNVDERWRLRITSTEWLSTLHVSRMLSSQVLMQTPSCPCSLTAVVPDLCGLQQNMQTTMWLIARFGFALCRSLCCGQSDIVSQLQTQLKEELHCAAPCDSGRAIK